MEWWLNLYLGDLLRLVNAAQHAQREGSRLACAGLGLGDEVLCLAVGAQNEREGGLLDLGGLVEAHGVDALEQLGAQLKVLKRANRVEGRIGVRLVDHELRIGVLRREARDLDGRLFLICYPRNMLLHLHLIYSRSKSSIVIGV